MENFETTEPTSEGMGENELTLEELSFVHRAIQHEFLEICIPPMSRETFDLASSASRKILNLMKEQYDKQRNTNE